MNLSQLETLEKELTDYVEAIRTVKKLLGAKYGENGASSDSNRKPSRNLPLLEQSAIQQAVFMAMSIHPEKDFSLSAIVGALRQDWDLKSLQFSNHKLREVLGNLIAEGRIRITAGGPNRHRTYRFVPEATP